MALTEQEIEALDKHFKHYEDRFKAYSEELVSLGRTVNFLAHLVSFHIDPNIIKRALLEPDLEDMHREWLVSVLKVKGK